MTERIRTIAERTAAGQMWLEPKITDFDKEDFFLPILEKNTKRVCEYIMNQEPMCLPEFCFTGYFTFDWQTGDIPHYIIGDIFKRRGYLNGLEMGVSTQNKAWYNLIATGYSHSAPDFGTVIASGIRGRLAVVRDSLARHKDDPEKTAFLQSQETFLHTVIRFAHKCSDIARGVSEKTDNPVYKRNLLRLSEVLLKVPEHPAESFYEAMASLYFLFAYNPDSIGLFDRYMYPYYKKDIESGAMTQEEAKEYIQEFFCLLQAKTKPTPWSFTRGGESHFAIGGYLPDGSDGFNELSRLLTEALIELPTWAPQISLRWTEKTPKDVLRFMMDCERRDKNKRIAFVNDEPRIRAFMKHEGLSFTEACRYTTVGCNETAMPGGIFASADNFNAIHMVESVFHRRTADVLSASTFEDFYRIFEEELRRDLNEMNRIVEGWTTVRSRDTNIVSNFLMNGCLERAMPCTNCRSADIWFPIMSLVGITNVYDAISVTKQIVYDERVATMQELVEALQKNWEGYGDLHTYIMKKGRFYGNDDAEADAVAQRVLDSIDAWNTGDNPFGKKWMFGDLVGYVPYHEWFGTPTRATPDGRYDGDLIKFGNGQSEGKDRNGLSALLNSVAKTDKNLIMKGQSVTNISLDAAIVKDDRQFTKLVDLFHAFFQNGGLHFQLSYVSREELLNARKAPEKYKSLRVRVSGYSEYYVNLTESLQDDVLARTVYE